MASIGHVAVGLAAGRAYAKGEAPFRAMLAFTVASLAPDADALAFVLGIPYGAPFGHRGASHALAMALAVGLVAGMGHDRAIHPRAFHLRAAVYTILVVASHGLLDAMTDGGRGVALFWPWSTARHFFAWRPIPVAPIGRGLVSSSEGRHVLGFELVAFAPLWLWALRPRRRTPP